MTAFSGVPRLVVLGVLIMAVLARAPAALAEQAGFVFEVSGHWASDAASKQDLRAGSSVDLGAAVRRLPPARTTDSILIIGRNGQLLASRRCSTAAICREPIRLPGAPEKDSVIASLVAAAIERLRDEEPRFTSVTGRGGLRLYEGVVLASSAGIDLSAVTGDLPPQTYTLVWRSLTSPAAGAREHRFSWERKAGTSPDLVADPSLAPDLYRLAAYGGAAPGAGAEALAEAWVLVVPQAAFAEREGRFRCAVEAAQTWAAEASSDTLRRFLRAVLAELAATPAGPSPP